MAFTERSRPAREAIPTAARAEFAREGYERSTVRSVATAARVDPSMVMRCYGSKEGLFAAAVDLDLQLPDLSELAGSEVAGALARHFVLRWEGDLADEAIILLLRSEITNEAAAQRLRTVFTGQVMTLVRTKSGDAADSEPRAGLISTHLLGIALTRYLLELPPMGDLPAEDVIAVVTPVLDGFLRGPLGVDR